MCTVRQPSVSRHGPGPPPLNLQYPRRQSPCTPSASPSIPPRGDRDGSASRGGLLPYFSYRLLLLPPLHSSVLHSNGANGCASTVHCSLLTIPCSLPHPLYHPSHPRLERHAPPALLHRRHQPVPRIPLHPRLRRRVRQPHALLAQVVLALLIAVPVQHHEVIAH